jgi:hypothetical protein
MSSFKRTPRRGQSGSENHEDDHNTNFRDVSPPSPTTNNPFGHDLSLRITLFVDPIEGNLNRDASRGNYVAPNSSAPTMFGSVPNNAAPINPVPPSVPTRAEFLRTLMPLTTEATQRPQPDEKCSICFENLEPSPFTGKDVVRMRRCGHFFHGSCVRPWFSERSNGTCPNCRARLFRPPGTVNARPMTNGRPNNSLPPPRQNSPRLNRRLEIAREAMARFRDPNRPRPDNYRDRQLQELGEILHRRLDGLARQRHRALSRSNMPEQPYGLVSRDALEHLRQRSMERQREEDNRQRSERRISDWTEQHRSALSQPGPDSDDDVDMGAGAQYSDDSGADEDG